MAGGDDYRECCRLAAAQDAEAAFCPDCRHPLLRCHAPGCAGLVTPLGHCPSCIALRLSIEKGAVLEARLGECLSVPFVLRNEAASRSLCVVRITSEGTNQPSAAVPLAWDRLDAGRARAFAVSAGPFDHGGINNLRLTIVVSAAMGDVEEKYVFTGDVAIDVEGRDPTQVVQHFNLAGADFGTAGMVVANPHASAAERRRRDADALGTRTEIPLERAERVELDQGYRGYQETGLRIARGVRVSYAGFPVDDRPPDGPLLQAVVRCGRNGRRADGRQTSEPNDLCLRVYESRTGQLDREASTAISRRVFDLVLANDRLHVRSVGSSGLALNGQALAAGDLRVVGSGDTLLVAAGGGKSVTVTAGFGVAGGMVTDVRIEKAG